MVKSRPSNMVIFLRYLLISSLNYGDLTADLFSLVRLYSVILRKFVIVRKPTVRASIVLGPETPIWTLLLSPPTSDRTEQKVLRCRLLASGVGPCSDASQRTFLHYSS